VKQNKKVEIKIAGILIPVDWDEEQRVAEVAIATADEKEYRIKKTLRGKQLFGHLQAYVEAAGSLSEGKDGGYVLTRKTVRTQAAGRCGGLIA